MDKKFMISTIILIILASSTLIFSITIGYFTYQIGSFSEKTTIIGKVQDTEGVPLEGVKVECGGVLNYSDKDGYWKLEGVNSGKVHVDLYLPGYVKSRYSWIAYPMDWIDGGKLNKSSNDLSEGEGIRLSKEITWNNLHETFDNISFKIYFHLNVSLADKIEKCKISNGSGAEEFILFPGNNSFMINGDGTYIIEPYGLSGNITGFNTAVGHVNLTKDMISIISGSDINERGNGTLSLDLYLVQGFDLEDEILLSCLNINKNEYYNTTIPELYAEEGLSVDLPEGRYDIAFSSETYRDIGYSSVIINRRTEENIEVNITKGELEEKFKGLSVNANYGVMAYYLVLSLFLFYGIYLARKGTSWLGFVLLCFISFLSRGIPVIGPINFNIMLASILVIVAFMMRGEFRTRYKKKVEQNQKSNGSDNVLERKE